MVATAVSWATISAAAVLAWTGANDGDTGGMMMSFPSGYSDTLDLAGGVMHNHGNTSMVFGVDLRINGVCTTVATTTIGTTDVALNACRRRRAAA